MDKNQRDINYMLVALEEAQEAYKNGELPIGALLVIDNEIVGIGSNIQTSGDNWTDHAESMLIRRFGPEIKKAAKRDLEIEIFSTLEPCLMCFGACVHNRANRIVYSCPDPAGGSTHIEAPTEWYGKRWPEIKGNVLRNEGYDIFVKYMKKTPESWKNVLPLFEEMQRGW